METEQNSSVIQIERQFDVDPATLFSAWTEGAHLKKWWHPMGESTTDVKNELEEGGAVEYNFGDSGLQITGTYSEVVPNEKLVYSWVWNINDEGSESGYTLTITFSSEGEGSKLGVMQEGFSGPEALPPHQDGWEKGLNDLAEYLAGNTKAGTSTAENAEDGQGAATRGGDEMTDRSGGYNESPEQAKVGGG